MGDHVTRVRGADLPGGEIEAERGDPSEELAAGERGEAMLRPEALERAEAGAPGAVAGEVVAARFGGDRSWATLRTAAGTELELALDGPLPRIGERLAVRLRTGARPRLFRAGDGADR